MQTSFIFGEVTPIQQELLSPPEEGISDPNAAKSLQLPTLNLNLDTALEQMLKPILLAQLLDRRFNVLGAVFADHQSSIAVPHDHHIL